MRLGTLAAAARCAPMLTHAPASHPARILVVEDDLLIRMILAEMLRDEGYDVVEAESGDAAVPLLDDGVALLITDMQMPGSLDGQGLARQARLTRPALPVIFTSGRRLGAAPASPHDLVIDTPYQRAEICAGVRQMLAEAPA